MGIIETVVDIYGAMSVLEQKTLLVRLGQKAIDDGVIDAPVVDASPPSGGGGAKYSKKGAKYSKKGRSKPWGRIVTKVDKSAKGMNQLEGEWFSFGDVAGLMKKQQEMSSSGREPIIIGHTNKDGEKSYIAGYSPALGWVHGDMHKDHVAYMEFRDGELMLHDFEVDGGMDIYCADMCFKFSDAVDRCEALLDFKLT